MGRQASLFKTPWGWMGVSETDKGLDAVALPQASKRRAAETLRSGGKSPYLLNESTRLAAARRQLVEYLSGTRRTFDLPVDLGGGTAFQRRVWRALLRVPYGKVRSYQWLALRVGGPQYARAVGGAVGANPLPIVIPCHRIVAQDATLGGFSGGLPTKRKLLDLEGSYAQLRRGRA
ncbi:MAG: methylated-DNA--[protein]-cysteine S-methyltransferase [Nitrospira sp.]